MAQRLLALGLIAAGVLSVALGVGSATLWRPADTVTATALPVGDGTFVITEPGVLDLVDPTVTVTAKSPDGGTVVLAVGRDIDVKGWAGDSPRTDVTGLKDWSTLSTTAQTPKPSASATGSPSASTTGSPSASPSASARATAKPSATASGTTKPTAGAGTDGSATSAPDPAGSDMWLAQATGKGSATLKWTDRSGRWSLIAAGVGDNAEAPQVTMTWPRSVSTPWLWVGVIVGLLLIAAGTLLRIVHLRSDRARKGGSAGTRARRLRGHPTGGADLEPAAEADTDTTTLPPVGRRAQGADAERPSTSVPREDDTQVLPPARTRREMREREEAARTTQASRPDGEGGPGKQRRAWLTGQIPLVRRPKTGTQPAVPPSHAVRGDAWRRSWGMAEEGASSTDRATRTSSDTPNAPSADGPRSNSGSHTPASGPGSSGAGSSGDDGSSAGGAPAQAHPDRPDDLPPAPRPRHGRTDGTQEDR